MTIDVSRYALITNEFRYAEVLIPAIETAYAKARELEIDSKFSSVSGTQTMANQIAAIIGSPKRRLEVYISDTDFLSVQSFIFRTPTCTIIAPKLGVNGKFMITRAVIDEDENQTVFEAWGG